MKTFIKKEQGFDIYFEALEEDRNIRDMLPDDTEEQIKETYDNNVLFIAKVTAEKAGIALAEEYLGGCIYATEEDFYIKYKDDYFADMVKTVIDEAEPERQNIIELLSR